MIEADVIIVGGGPGGSACAWRLRHHGINAIILDQVSFPRFKPCAGWITPEVLHALNFRPSEYPYGLVTIRSFEIWVKQLHFRLPSRQHAIRRIEFDEWLLKRSGAPFYQHTVKQIQKMGDGYEVDGEFCGKYLVGAGGTHCPVYRNVFRDDYPKSRKALIAAQEEEFPYPDADPQCRLWFFQHDLPGYAWYVPKANGIVNVGVGGMADQLNAKGDNLKNHWAYLVEMLDAMGLVRGHAYKPSAHTYFLRQKNPLLRKDNAYLVGDSAALATLDMGEGICPAITSGLLAADSIAHGTPYSVKKIPRYSIGSFFSLF